jgi:hypothetical protein
MAVSKVVMIAVVMVMGGNSYAVCHWMKVRSSCVTAVIKATGSYIEGCGDDGCCCLSWW